MQVERQTGQTPEDLDGPEIPPQMEHLWEWFLELHGARGYGHNGPQPISYGEIEAWASLCNKEPSQWEVKLLRRLDNIYIDGTQNGFSQTEHRD